MNMNKYDINKILLKAEKIKTGEIEEKRIKKVNTNFKWETIRSTFEMSETDVKDVENEEELYNNLLELKSNRGLSAYLKRLIIEDFEKRKTVEYSIETIASKIQERIKFEKQYESLAEDISERILEKIQNYDFSDNPLLEHKISKGEKLTDKDINNILRLE